jgi:hypothetical protein
MVAVIVSAVLVHISNLSVFKDPSTGALRNFGVKSDETLFPAWMAFACVGYLTYVLVAGSRMSERQEE